MLSSALQRCFIRRLFGSDSFLFPTSQSCMKKENDNTLWGVPAPFFVDPDKSVRFAPSGKKVLKKVLTA